MPHQDAIDHFDPFAPPVRKDRPRRRARNRRERLVLALAHLERAGITGASAYSPGFRALTRIGVIPKPLHYRSLPGLTLFACALLCVVFGGLVALTQSLGITPGPIRAILDVGPAGFLSVNLLLGLAFAALIRIQAISAGLPSWRDL